MVDCQRLRLSRDVAYVMLCLWSPVRCKALEVVLCWCVCLSVTIRPSHKTRSHPQLGRHP